VLILALVPELNVELRVSYAVRCFALSDRPRL
jgi:hypothetical protein